MSTAAYPTSWRPPPAFFGTRTRQHAAVIAALLYVVWSVSTLNVDVNRALAGFGRAVDLFVRMVPPDFSRRDLLVRGMVESLQMAFARHAARAWSSACRWASPPRATSRPGPSTCAARGLIVVGRTFHEVIIAIFFVKLFGFGAVAGLLTLAFHSVIFLAKMLAEDIENVRVGPIEAVRATGAGFLQVVVYSVVPQVLTRSVGTAIYRLDANVRHSTVVGIVGAGGIGQTLSASFSRYDYDFAAAILLCIIALVALGEWFSDWVRAKLR